MINTEYTTYASEKAEKNFENIKKSIKGLYEILNFIGNEDDIYHQAGEDNIVGLYQNFVELLTNEYGLRQIVRSLKNAKLELNITWDEFQVDKN
jgi:hypothetical protein